jgi:hypothetical protein
MARDLAELKEQLERWRKHNRRGARLPEEFWREAVAMAREQGVFRVAKALPVDWRTLKKKMAAGEPVFVEARTTERAVRPAHAVEVETARGRVRVTGLGVSELAELLRALGA